MSAKLQARFDEARTLLERGQHDRAEAGFKNILQKDPCHYPSLFMLGLTAYQRKQFKQAARYYNQVIELTPCDADAHFELANSLHELRQLEAALSSMDRAIKLCANNADYHCNRGLILKDLERNEEALTSYDTALHFNRNDAEIWYNRGNILRTQEKYLDALSSYTQALKIRPSYYDAWNGSGLALHQMRQHQAGVDAFKKAIALQPDAPEAYCNAAHSLDCLNLHEQALHYYGQASQRLKPNTTSQQHSIFDGSGLAILHLNQPEKAEQLHRQAIEAAPKEYIPRARFNLSMTLLVQGKFNEGWAEYEHRHILNKKNRPLLTPKWNGSPTLAGKILFLKQEQGLGDLIQFSRYARLAVQLGAQVIIETPKPLSRLFSGLGHGIKVTAPEEPTPEHDLHLSLLSMPLVMQTAAHNIPAQVPYLSIDKQITQHWTEKLSIYPRKRIGLVWAGNPDFENDHNRSIPLAMLQPLFSAIDAHWFCLQKDIRNTDIEAMQASPMINCADQFSDFADTAACIENLDLVISVDTAVAHLAGAMGKPVWILLPFSPDFRWLLEKKDSAWYPTAHLFRQTAISNWSDTIRTIADKLKTL